MKPEEQLEAALSSPDAQVRRDAVVEVGRHELEQSGVFANSLLTALGDADWRVREEAMRVVRGIAVERGLLLGLVAGVAQGANVGLRNAAREVLRELGAAAAHALIEALPDAEPSARKFLIEALACGGAEEAIDALVAAVRGEDSLVAVSAMDALALLGGDRAVAALRDKLRAAEAFERAAALDALVRLDVVLPWAELAPLLADRVLRRVALSALGGTGDERAVPYLVSALAEKSPHSVSRALIGLRRLHQHGGTLRGLLTRALMDLPAVQRERLRGFVADEDPAIALAACVVLACARDPEALPLALALCGRGSAPADVAIAFAAWGEEAIVLLSRAAADGSAARAAAIELACELCVLVRPVASTTALLVDSVREALTDRDAVLRRAALRALVRFGQPRDAALLLSHARDEALELAQLAGAALFALAERDPAAVRAALLGVAFSGFAATMLAELAVQVGVQDAAGRLRAALLSDEVQTRVAALVGLARLGGADAHELIVLALTDESDEVQGAALDALASSTSTPISGATLEALLAFVSDDVEVEDALARTLASEAAPDDQRVRVRLRALARDGSPAARLSALQGLTRLRDPSADGLLVHALSDHDSEVVKQALSGLAEAGGARAGARIALALSHAAWDVRRLAAIWLGRLRVRDAEPALREQLARESDDYVRAALRDALASLEVR